MYQIQQQFLTPNKYSRPQKPMDKIKAIVIHWVANPNSSAMANRNYFENRKNGNDNYGSAHEIIDLDGNIVACIPPNEISYNCGSETYTPRCLSELGNSPNYCTYGIECTHIDWNGKMTAATYNTLMERCVDLCFSFGLDPLKNIWTHKDVVGWKDCHLWFTSNPKEWEVFKNRVNSIYQSRIQKEITKPMVDEELKNIIEVLASYTNADGTPLMNKEYWLANTVEGSKPNPLYVAQLIKNLSKKIIY